MEAGIAGRDRQKPLRADWEEVKDEVRIAVQAKFEQHPDLRETLLATGEEEIVEQTSNDYYWGCGKKGTGKNMLGVILMQIRTELAGE
ncbi:NADAR family protein [Mechercharimyces sp. CAU 1602]|nr:NADAR family protein [Mechercharimyces sp. CAU 1602]MCS1351584.1 NADAR family protein [Mechercharimyces sp. CAU 1602]